MHDWEKRDEFEMFLATRCLFGPVLIMSLSNSTSQYFIYVAHTLFAIYLKTRSLKTYKDDKDVITLNKFSKRKVLRFFAVE